jgi:hypothetical protein
VKGGGFDALVIGGKPKMGRDDEDADSPDDEEKSSSFGEAGAGMAVRAFIKAIGADVSSVDMGKATKAFKAAVVACKGDDEDY